MPFITTSEDAKLIHPERPYLKTDTLIEFGSAIKRHKEGHYGGHVVLFGTPDEHDTYGDYFTSGTDFDLPEDNAKSAVYYQHTYDYHFKSAVLSRATLGTDDLGIWIDTQMTIHDEYLAALDQMIADGMMGWSSGTAGHLVEIMRTGKAYWIKRWPLGLDASITPSPADPRQVGTLKFLQDEWSKKFGAAPRENGEMQRYFSFKGLSAQLSPVVEALSGDEESSEDSADVTLTVGQGVTSFSITYESEDDMPEDNGLSLESMNARMDKFSENMGELMEYIKSQPNLRRAGYVTDDGGTADPNHKSLGDFCLAVMRKDNKRLRSIYKSRNLGDVALKTDLTEDSGNLGGWLVPSDFSLELLKLTMEASSFLGLIPRQAVSLPSGRWPMFNIFATPTAGSGNTALAGGVTSGVRAQGGAFVETNPTFEQLEWRVNDVIAGSVQVEKELSRDVAQIEGILRQAISIHDMSKQEYFVLNGNGVGQPLGVLNSDALISVTGAAANVFSWIDALTMFSRLKVINRNTVRWTLHPSVIPDLGTMEVGTAGGAVFIANMSGGVPTPLLGYLTGLSEHLPQANSPNDVVLNDWSAYQIWDLGGAYVDFSEHVGFLNGLDTWRFGRYMDGKPLWPSEQVLADPTGSYTLSPYVAHNDA